MVTKTDHGCLHKILQTAGRVLKNKPYKDLDGNEINIYVEQFYSPKVTELRNKALKIRDKSKMNIQIGLF